MALAGVSLQLALSTWLLLSGLNLNSDRYDRQLQALADFTRFERGIGREVLTSRAGLSRNYDALVKAVRDYEAALQRLRERGFGPRRKCGGRETGRARRPARTINRAIQEQ